jgi:hypothetical protein
MGENVPSGTRDPRFRDQATIPESVFFVAEMVNDVIQNFYWEAGIRHRGSPDKASVGAW